jgi:hypothetical protein
MTHEHPDHYDVDLSEDSSHLALVHREMSNQYQLARWNARHFARGCEICERVVLRDTFRSI